MEPTPQTDRLVRRVILVEGAGNLFVLLAKVWVGLSTGSLAILGDAVHSLTDIANNIVAWVVIKFSTQPADADHPYGHRKFETLAVFGLATLLTVLAFELVLHAIRREPEPILSEPWGLYVMGAVLIVNIAMATWQQYWAKKLNSPILHADATHTFADVMTTVLVIGGWQLSTMGYPWLDTVCAIGVAIFVLVLALKLFKRVVPVLVDEVAVEPEYLINAALSIEGVQGIRRVRSRWVGPVRAVDMVILVNPGLSIEESHEIADRVEALLEKKFQVRDSSIHMEPVS